MRKLVVVTLFLTVSLAGCGGGEEDQAAGQPDQATEKLPNQEACEIIRDNAGREEAEKAERFDRAVALAEGELVPPLRFLADFAKQNPDFFDDTNADATDLSDLNALGPVLEATTKLTAECAKAGVALPVG